MGFITCSEWGGGGGGWGVTVNIGVLSIINYLIPTREPELMEKWLNNEIEILNLVINALHVKLLDFKHVFFFFLPNSICKSDGLFHFVHNEKLKASTLTACFFVKRNND